MARQIEARCCVPTERATIYIFIALLEIDKIITIPLELRKVKIIQML